MRTHLVLALTTTLALSTTAPALAQTWNGAAGGYNTGYGTVYGSFGVAMATQNIYNSVQLQTQRLMMRQAMIARFGLEAVEKAEREASAGKPASPAAPRGPGGRAAAAAVAPRGPLPAEQGRRRGQGLGRGAGHHRRGEGAHRDDRPRGPHRLRVRAHVQGLDARRRRRPHLLPGGQRDDLPRRPRAQRRPRPRRCSARWISRSTRARRSPSSRTPTSRRSISSSSASRASRWPRTWTPSRARTRRPWPQRARCRGS
jgi:hypothetical protein